MNRLKVFGPHALLLALALFVFSTLPLATALQFEVDEGYEVMKAFLHCRGFELYRQIWDDQPPLFTLLLSSAFKLWGPTILNARLVSAGFGLLLVLVFYEMVRQRSGVWPGLIAAFFLFTAPFTLLLSVAVMQEGPTFATSLLATLFLFNWTKRRQIWWLFLSGATFALALQVKFTAAMVLPAIIVEILFAHWCNYAHGNRKRENSFAKDIRTSLRAAIRDIVLWSLPLLVLFTLTSFLWAKGSFEIAWRAHTGGHTIGALGGPEDARFSMDLLVAHWECVGAAILGLILMAVKKHHREYIFPLVLLLTAASIHSVHKPWWNYYYLHWAIPLAWLAGLATSNILEAGLRLISKNRFRLSLVQTWQGIAVCSLALVALARSEARLEQSANRLRKSERIDSNPIIATMRQYSGATKWAYSNLMIYPFHARCLAPPELAVVTLKRFWSGQITQEDIVRLCKRYHPEQVVLQTDAIGPDWKDYLQESYRFQMADQNGMGLYILDSSKRQ